MTVLVFNGKLARGAHRFAAELRIPGSGELPIEIPSWPVHLHPGTLNLKISRDGFPSEYLARFNSPSIAHLDTRLFRPIAELAANCIANNTLPPTKERPDRGNAQIWRASVLIMGSHKKADCWVLRRIGSGYRDVVECVSGQRLRDVLSAPESPEVQAQLHMYGQWDESEPVNVL